MHFKVIVNGQIEGTGNNARDSQALIAKGGVFSVTQTVTIDHDEESESVAVSGPANEGGLIMVIRYSSKTVDVHISHGEYDGHTLPHNHVV